VEVPGFKRLATNIITLEVNQTARVDLALEVGAVTETLEVKDVAPLLQTENTQLGHVVSGNTTVNLPLNGRNFAQLTLLSPGVVTYGMGTFTSGTGGQPLVNGNRAQANNYRLDGMDSNEIQDNGTASHRTLTPFRVSPDHPNAPAGTGNSMGTIVNTSLKSGTNHFTARRSNSSNDHVNANNWFSNATQPRDQFSQNIFGGVGWTDPRNRLFFFVDYRALSPFGPQPVPAYVDPGSMADRRSLQPDQAALQPLNQVNNANGTVTRGAFPNNQIPASYRSRCANLFADQSIYPLPLFPGNTQNWTGAGRSKTNSDIGDIKIDYSLSTKDNFVARFSIGETDDSSYDAQRLNPTLPSVTTPRSVVVSWNHIFSPSVLNEARVGVNRTRTTALTSDTGNVGNLGENSGIPRFQQSRTRSAAAHHFRRHSHWFARERHHRRVHHIPVHRQPDDHSAAGIFSRPARLRYRQNRFYRIE
jgi:hypothetical protein